MSPVSEQYYQALRSSRFFVAECLFNSLGASDDRGAITHAMREIVILGKILRLGNSERENLFAMVHTSFLSVLTREISPQLSLMCRICSNILLYQEMMIYDQRFFGALFRAPNPGTGILLSAASLPTICETSDVIASPIYRIN